MESPKIQAAHSGIRDWPAIRAGTRLRIIWRIFFLIGILAMLEGIAVFVALPFYLPAHGMAELWVYAAGALTHFYIGAAMVLFGFVLRVYSSLVLRNHIRYVQAP